MESIYNYINEKLVINKNIKVQQKNKNWVSIDDFDDEDFADAVNDYGEFEYEDILMALNGEKLEIKGKVVKSILVDDDLMYSYSNGKMDLETPLNIDDIDDDTLEKLYNWLIGNKE